MNARQMPITEGWEITPTGGVIRTGGLRSGNYHHVAVRLTPADQIPTPPPHLASTVERSNTIRGDEVRRHHGGGFMPT